MAQQVTVQLVDDMDGSEASETVTFAVDGISYEIDLSEKNAGKFRKALDPFMEKARRTGKVKGRASRVHVAGSSGEPGKAAKVREWAATAGIDVPAKGRVPASVMEQYDAAHPAA